MPKAEEFTLQQKASREGLLTLYDAAKHLTTLGTGSIVILSAFLERFFSNAKDVGLIVGSMILFLVTILGAVIAMIAISNQLQEVDIVQEERANTKRVLLVSYYALALGVTLLVLFTFHNLF